MGVAVCFLSGPQRRWRSFRENFSDADLGESQHLSTTVVQSLVWSQVIKLQISVRLPEVTGAIVAVKIDCFDVNFLFSGDGSCSSKLSSHGSVESLGDSTYMTFH